MVLKVILVVVAVIYICLKVGREETTQELLDREQKEEAEHERKNW